MRTLKECRDVMDEVALRDAVDYYPICPSAFAGGFGPAEEQWVKKIQADALEYAATLARREDITKTEFLLQLSIKHTDLLKPPSDPSHETPDSKEPPS